MIFKSFFAMLAVNGDLFVPDFLERLARAQSEEGLRLPPRFFALWREAMLKTVRACDPLCDEEILTGCASRRSDPARGQNVQPLLRRRFQRPSQ